MPGAFLGCTGLSHLDAFFDNSESKRASSIAD
jgi:hypothetical protein